MTDRAELAEFLGLVALGMSDRKTQDKLYEAASALSAQQPVANDEAVATLLMCAWTEYVALFGAQPHGTFKQLNALLALQGAGRKIAALYASPPPAQQQGPTEAEIELARDIIEIAGNEERIEVELARAVLRMAGKP